MQHKLRAHKTPSAPSKSAAVLIFDLCVSEECAVKSGLFQAHKSLPKKRENAQRTTIFKKRCNWNFFISKQKVQRTSTKTQERASPQRKEERRARSTRGTEVTFCRVLFSFPTPTLFVLPFFFKPRPRVLAASSVCTCVSHHSESEPNRVWSVSGVCACVCRSR